MTDTTLATGAIGFATAGVNMMFAEAPVDALSQVPWDKIGSGVSLVVALVFALRFMANLYAKSQTKMEALYEDRIKSLENDKRLLIERCQRQDDIIRKQMGGGGT